MKRDECTLGEILADVFANVVPSESLAWLEIDITPDIDWPCEKWSKS